MFNIEERVKKILEEQIRVTNAAPTSIGNDSNLQHDLGFDSLDTVEVAIAIEDEFDIDIPDEDLEKAKTVQQLIDLGRLEEGRNAQYLRSRNAKAPRCRGVRTVHAVDFDATSMIFKRRPLVH